MALHQHWSEGVRQREADGQSYVLVTIIGARGSTPRDSGTKMVVGDADFTGTIGGGELEHQALVRARQMLAGAENGQWLENFPLGEKLGQCCGGSASLLFECFVPRTPPVFLFGAGHVGRALAPILASLPLRVFWVDARTHEFPELLPAGVEALHPQEPVDVIADAPAGAYFLIMTHQHPLDFALMEAALARGDSAYIGVIGSQSKWRRFRLRLTHRGYADDAIEHVSCPVGLTDVPGKRPAEIAVSIAAELITHYHARHPAAATAAGPAWKSLQEQLQASDASLKQPMADKT